MLVVSYSLSLNTLAQFSSHAWVHLNNGGLLGLLKNTNRQITRTGTDFEDHIGGLQVGLVDNTLGDEGILENVLTKFVGIEDGILGGGARVLVRGVDGVRVGGGCTGRARSQTG